MDKDQFDLDVMHAKNLDYCFTELNEWIYKLLDKYIDKTILSV
jgi:hypothetical protein